VTAAGLDLKEWTPREQRHTFVSVLSDEDVPIEKISDLVGHKDQTTTETVYHHQIRPVVLHGAEAMDRIFPRRLVRRRRPVASAQRARSRPLGCKLPARTTTGGRRQLASGVCDGACEWLRAPVAVHPAVRTCGWDRAGSVRSRS
jgi:hypothetical protein